MQPLMRSTDLVEVKFACLFVGFTVLFSALYFYSGQLTSHYFILSGPGS